MHMLAFSAVKGGVGKTTAAVNVAAAAARRGVATVVWDLDPQAAACHLLGVEPEAGPPPRRGLWRRRAHHPMVATGVDDLKVIPASIDLGDEPGLSSARHIQRVARDLTGTFDLIVLDLPAGVDAAVEAAVVAGVGVVVPIVPSLLAVRSYEQFIAFAEAKRPAGGRRVVRGFASMVDPQLERHRQFVEELRRTHPETLTTWIPATVEVERACERRLPVASAFPRGRAAASFDELWRELATPA